MTIAEYLEYERKVNENHISNTKSYLPTYFGKSAPSHDPIQEFAHYFDPNQPSAESDCDSEDMEEEVEYMTDDEVVMSEQEENNHGYTQNIQHFEEKDDVDEWLNAEITKHMSMQGVKNMKDALISIIKSIRHEMKDGIMKRQFEASTASDEVSFIASNEVDRADNNTLNTAPCRLTKELSPGSFLLPININSHNLYATTTLDAKDNIMPQRVYEYLGLDKLRDTSTLENTTGTNEHLGTVNILVKFGELEFSCDFIIKMVEDVIILGRPFFESTRAQIDVFNEEISFEIGSKKFKFNIDSYQSIEKIYMVDIGQEEETFNPLEIRIYLFSYASPACLEFEQRTRSYGTPNLQDEIAKPISFSPDRRGLVKRWHVCKPIHVTYDDRSGEDYGMWPTCDPNLKFCFGYNEVFKGHQEQGDDELRPRSPRPCNYSFEEWLKIRIGHNNLQESDREFIFNEWILDSYDVKEEYAREIGNPYSRRFNEYNRVFNNEIEHLSNEYILRIGKKGYVLDDVWENVNKTTRKPMKHGMMRDTRRTKYGGRSFICIIDHEDEALPLRRVNGARFKAMIRKELEGNKYVHEYPEAVKQLLRPARLIIMWPPSGLKGLLHMLNATVIPTKGIQSLREDRDNLKDFRQISKFEAMLR
ncbi:phospholipase-like protein [Tanacetum coccineum]